MRDDTHGPGLAVADAEASGPPTPSHEYVAFDLETTGLLAASDRVVEIGAVRFDPSGREIGRFEVLVNPGRPIPWRARAVHGISDEDVASAPTVEKVLPAFLAFLGDPESTTMLAHNASFDAGFLGHELGRLGWDSPGHAVADTLALARAKLPHLPNFRLDTIVGALNLDPQRPHRALGDSLLVKGVWLALGGHDVPTGSRVAYRIADARRPVSAPVGWDGVAEAIVRGRSLRLEYAGGSRGSAPRTVTPRAIVQRGGVSYLVAVCHLDAREKKFRLDRVARYEVLT